MGITLNSAAPNNAKWETQFQFNDAESGDLIDFTGASIEIEVKDFDGCQLIEGTTGNGYITIDSLGIFTLEVPSSVMANLCPGTYKIGGIYTPSGEDDPISLFTGSLAIIDGVATA